MLGRFHFRHLEPGVLVAPNERSYRVSTLGCRVNRADSLSIERELAGRGYRRALAGEVPTVWVVNTCAVTGEGMRKSRKLVRRCARSGARVVVTGCGADFDPEALRVPGVAAVVPNKDKSIIGQAACPDDGGEGQKTGSVPWSPEELVRVPLKVQEGCGRFCSYCIVPYLRPPPHSVPSGSVLAEVRALRSRGVGEIVLCGIDLGSYREPSCGDTLESLVASVLEEAGDMWVRLSSIELSDVNDGLVGLLAEENSLCGQLHLPLQSGDERVLSDMGREYEPDEFKRKVEEIRDIVPGIGITTDVMVGFPTEDERAFLNTRGLLSSAGFSRAHVFRYSPRRGTAAFPLGDPVAPEVKYKRAAELRETAREGARRFHDTFVGRIIPVLVEARMENEPGCLFARARSFAGVVMEGSEELVGSCVEVEITSAGPEAMRGRIERMEPGRNQGR